MTGTVVVTAARVVVRHRTEDDPFTPGPWHDLVVAHALAERGFVRVVAFAASTDERTQHLLERVGLRAVAADGDDLLYLRRAAAGDGS